MVDGLHMPSALSWRYGCWAFQARPHRVVAKVYSIAEFLLADVDRLQS